MNIELPLSLGVPVPEAQMICVFVHRRDRSPEAMGRDVNCLLNTPAVAFVVPHGAGGGCYVVRAVDGLPNHACRERGPSIAADRPSTSELAQC